MTFKSGFTNENTAVRWERAPGPLREAAGFTYQEFSNLEKPLALKGDPFHAGEETKSCNGPSSWISTTAKPSPPTTIPSSDDGPPSRENQFGNGTLTYEGTALSDGLQQAVVQHALRQRHRL